MDTTADTETPEQVAERITRRHAVVYNRELTEAIESAIINAVAVERERCAGIAQEKAELWRSRRGHQDTTLDQTDTGEKVAKQIEREILRHDR
jgi:hypothetical protein